MADNEEEEKGIVKGLTDGEACDAVSYTENRSMPYSMMLIDRWWYLRACDEESEDGEARAVDHGPHEAHQESVPLLLTRTAQGSETGRGEQGPNTHENLRWTAKQG